MVSHDLGNPLSVILLEVAHLLRHLPESEDQRTRTLGESVALIRRSTMRMKALIDDLLELERLGAKRFPVNVQPVESRDLLEDARIDAQPLADAKHISLVLRSDRSTENQRRPAPHLAGARESAGQLDQVHPRGRHRDTSRAVARRSALGHDCGYRTRDRSRTSGAYSIAIGDPGDRKERERASGSTSRGESWRRMADACGPSLLPKERPSSSRCRSNPAATERSRTPKRHGRDHAPCLEGAKTDAPERQWQRCDTGAKWTNRSGCSSHPRR